jgi:hypothetical protein
MKTTVIIDNTRLTQVVTEDEIIHIDIKECNDFDYVIGKINDIAEDGNLNGPDQMRIIATLAEAFLDAHIEDHELGEDVFCIFRGL